MNKLMLKVGLGVLAAGTLAGAGVLAVGSGGDAAKPAVSVTQRPVHGANAGFEDPDQGITLGTFSTPEECSAAAQAAQSQTPGRNIQCVDTHDGSANPFAVISRPLSTGPADGTMGTGPDGSQQGNPSQAPAQKN